LIVQNVIMTANPPRKINIIATQPKVGCI
jgi:hypothetical protein